MTKGVTQSGRLIFGALAVAALIAGTRVYFNPDGQTMNPDGTVNSGPTCWRGTIEVKVDRYAHEEENCNNEPQQWRGIAMVQLREELENTSRTKMVDGSLVKEVVGLEADLRYDWIQWKIEKLAYSRSCWEKDKSQRWGNEKRYSEHDLFQARGEDVMGVDERGRPKGNVAGTILYKVPEDANYGPDYGRSGQYRLNRLPVACDSHQDWVTPGRNKRDQFEVPVACIFGDTFAGSVGIGFKGTACQDKPRFLLDLGRFPEDLATMKGQFECQVTDNEMRSPSARAETGLIYVNWSLQQDVCQDTLPPGPNF